MSYAVILGSMFVVHVLALISPGPNVFIVTQTAMSRTRRAGMATALGISTGSFIWASAALVGLDIVFSHYPWLYSSDSLLFHFGLAFFCSTDRVREVYAVVKRRVDRIAGTALGLLGLKLLAAVVAGD